MTSTTLQATYFLDHDHPDVRSFAEQATGRTPRERAVSLYYQVRDGIRYEIYGADLSQEGLRASQVLHAGSGMCVHKSVLYGAALRALGTPSRLVLVDVRNHLASERLIKLIGGDVFHYHCLTSVNLEGRWVKATPVFNKLLCRLYGMTPLEFDGLSDSVYHPFDQHNRRHMEIVRNRGVHSDLPYRMLIDGLRAAHPGVFADGTTLVPGSLTADVPAPAPTTVGN
ncbi:transglutaminase family protein [Spongiactinospora sp. 9N601]|uniref:transglutaminase family protein n=1 Tax=Spongiactinospora sp. 9N601 TaxID=3375149 RepID=UPI00379B3741